MKRALRSVAIVLALSGAAAVGAWQSSQASLPPGTGAIRGRVIDIASGAPIASATVTLFLQANRGSRSADSDSDGRFTFEQVPAGTFDFSARKDGYYGGRYGQRNPFSANQPFELADGEQADGAELPLWRTATLSGRVLSADGQPVPGVTVQVLGLSIEQGVRHLRAAQYARTDAAGRYVINGIVPTTYSVAVVSTVADGFAQGGGASQAFVGYPTTFYPASASADGATLITIAAGEERRDVNFTLATAGMVSVAGSVAGLPADMRAPVIEMFPAQQVSPSTNVAVAKAAIRPDGRFRFPRVPAGSYVLRAVVFPAPERQPGFRVISQQATAGGFSMISGSAEPSMPLAPVPSAPTMWGTAMLTVSDRDLAGVTIMMRAGGRISGQIEFDGAAPRPTAAQLLGTPVVVMSVDGRELDYFQMARFEADGRFTTVGLPPGVYGVMAMTGMVGRISAGWDQAWRPVPTRFGARAATGGAIEVGDTDVTDVTLTFSDSFRPTELSGVVHEASGRVRADGTVYVFPVDRNLWARAAAVREVRPGRSGRYTISGLPPLEYFVVAVTDEAGELWREQTYLAKLSATAARVTIAAGESKTLDLNIR